MGGSSSMTTITTKTLRSPLLGPPTGRAPLYCPIPRSPSEGGAKNRCCGLLPFSSRASEAVTAFLRVCSVRAYLSHAPGWGMRGAMSIWPPLYGSSDGKGGDMKRSTGAQLQR